MSNIRSVHIVKEDNGKFEASIDFEDGETKAESFDSFEEANTWLISQEESGDGTDSAEPKESETTTEPVA